MSEIFAKFFLGITQTPYTYGGAAFTSITANQANILVNVAGKQYLVQDSTATSLAPSSYSGSVNAIQTSAYYPSYTPTNSQVVSYIFSVIVTTRSTTTSLSTAPASVIPPPNNVAKLNIANEYNPNIYTAVGLTLSYSGDFITVPTGEISSVFIKDFVAPKKSQAFKLTSSSYPVSTTLDGSAQIPDYIWVDLGSDGLMGTLLIMPLRANMALNTTLGKAFDQNTNATTLFTFIITRSGDTSNPENITYAVSGSSVVPASVDDFRLTPAKGTLFFVAGQSSQVFTLTLGDYLSEIAPNVGFTISLTDSRGGTSSATGNIQTPTTPTKGVLADIADAVYTPSINQADGYIVFDRLSLTDVGGGFNIETFQNGNQLVIAFKGTDTLDDFIADASWAFAAPNSFLKFFYDHALAYVQSIVKRLPTAAITLTGHSLGGAIAELVSEATSYSAIVFNAPGPRQYENYLGITKQLNILSNVTNYRVLGDQVSLSGTQAGNMLTLYSKLPTDWANALENHRLGTVISNLALTPQKQENALPKPDLLIGVALAIGKNLVGLSVGANHLYGLDPSGSSAFTFQLDVGSPAIKTIEMPPFEGVAAYKVAFLGGTGSTQQTVLPNQIVTAPDGTRTLNFAALDASGSPVILPDNTIFGVSFASAGTLNAVISASTVSGTTPGASSSPVYRFFDTAFGTHLFTQSLTEAQTILTTRSDLVQETNGFGSVSSINVSAEPVYRFFETSNGTHFFTASKAEYQGLTNPGSSTYRADFTYEASSTFYEDSIEQIGDMPVYRLFDSARGTQFLTSNETEYAGLTLPSSSTYRADLQPEGVAFYAPVGIFHT